ncbi:MAG: hypothetical protein O2887_14320 [Bacteroidetes bacterium]|nr:hypothetical protein [Bacteroidota bacterium]MDA1121645.1 hypothetical protein [Bacteroidota bacterium]
MNFYSLRLFFLLAFLSIFFSGYSATFTSTQSGDWDVGTTWVGSVAPGPTDDVVIAAGHTVTLTGPETIDFIVINFGGFFDYDGNVLTVTTPASISPFISVKNGDWDIGTTWLNTTAPSSTDDAFIAPDHTVFLNASTTIDDVTISAGAVVYTLVRTFTVDGSLIHNGTYFIQNNSNKHFTMNGTSVSGTGTVQLEGTGAAGNNIIFNNDITVESGSRLKMITVLGGEVQVTPGFTVTNEGEIEITGNLVEGGGAGTGTWEQGSNSILLLKNEVTDIVLDASSNTPNTVDYNGLTDQTLYIPSSSTYNNLTLSGSGTKTVTSDGDLTISGDLTINESVVFDVDLDDTGAVSALTI